MERTVYLKLTDLDAARDLWLKKLEVQEKTPLGSEAVPLAAARLRTLSEPAAALLPRPFTAQPWTA